MKALTLVLVSLVLAACDTSSQSSGATLPVVMMGDSITYYWNDPTWTNEADLISSHVRDLVDVGVHGETCVQMEARFDRDVLALHPAVVVIECGTNDVGQNRSSDLSPLFAMVDRAVGTGAKVIVGNLPPNAFWVYVVVHDDMPLFAYWRSEILANASVHGYVVANYTPAMELPDGDLNPELFADDNTHPDSAGYAVIWSILRPFIPANYVTQ